LTIRYYGLAIAIGMLVAITIARRRYARLGGDPDLADVTGIVAVVAGVVGARVGHVITNFGTYVDDPITVFAVWRGGLTFYTGLLFGAIAAIWWLRRRGGDLPAFADAAAPAIPIAQAFGRWGNYFNQELYGTPTDLPWALEVEGLPHTVHPTFAYEMLGNLVIAGILFAAGARTTLRRGSLLFGYLMGYGVLRFGMELLRTDTTFRFLGLSRNAWGSVLVFLIGAVGLWLHQRRPLLPDWSSGKEAAAGGDEAADRETGVDVAERPDSDE
jgi:prolipoprotein diacylglyceryl transferase